LLDAGGDLLGFQPLPLWGLSQTLLYAELPAVRRTLLRLGAVRTVVALPPLAGAILRLVDGRRSVGEIVATHRPQKKG